MRDIFKNTTLYYILVPVMVGLWPLLVWAVYLPKAKSSWDKEKDKYNEGQVVIEEILQRAPDRLESADLGQTIEKFEYAPAIAEVAGLSGISASNYQLTEGTPRPSQGRTLQTCHVVLKQTDMKRFAEFLSTLQLRWTDLECDRAVFTKKKGLPDAWKVDLDFKYYY
ncbi:MAG: hypothetical protein ACYTEL_08035 [Planctomycetota bacterium]|jgi:hypothetical protein